MNPPRLPKTASAIAPANRHPIHIIRDALVELADASHGVACLYPKGSAANSYYGAQADRAREWVAMLDRHRKLERKREILADLIAE